MATQWGGIWVSASAWALWTYVKGVGSGISDSCLQLSGPIPFSQCSCMPADAWLWFEMLGVTQIATVSYRAAEDPQCIYIEFIIIIISAYSCCHLCILLSCRQFSGLYLSAIWKSQWPYFVSHEIRSINCLQGLSIQTTNGSEFSFTGSQLTEIRGSPCRVP